MTAEHSERTLQLGRIGRTIGLDGGLLFHAAGPAEAELLQPGLQLRTDDGRELSVAALRRHNRGLVIHFAGIRRLEPARELTNRQLHILIEHLPDGFGSSDLVAGLTGLPVRQAGTELGTVARVEGAAGHEYLVLEPGGQLLPLHAPYVQVTDAAIELTDPPDGLL